MKKRTLQDDIWSPQKPEEELQFQLYQVKDQGLLGQWGVIRIIVDFSNLMSVSPSSVMERVETRKVSPAANYAIRCMSPWLCGLPTSWSILAFFLFASLVDRSDEGRINVWMMRLKISWFRHHSGLLTLHLLSQSAFWFRPLRWGLLWKKGGTVPPISLFPLFLHVASDSLFSLSYLNIWLWSYCVTEPWRGTLAEITLSTILSYRRFMLWFFSSWLQRWWAIWVSK